MTNAEFLALLVSNTNKTTHLRTYTGHWFTCASRAPNSLLSKIGKIVALLQQQIDEGKLCDKQNEHLLIYNFQPAAVSDDLLFCNLNMLIKPLNEINHTEKNTGKLLEVMVDSNKQRLINNTQAMLELGLVTEDEIKQEKLDPPTELGYYSDYNALCCFVAFASYKPIVNTADLFAGRYDKDDSMQQSVAFDSSTEAYQYLEERKALGRYILEISCAREDYPLSLKAGVSKLLLNVVNFFDRQTEVNSNETITFPKTDAKEEFKKTKVLALERKSSQKIQVSLANTLNEEPGKRKTTLSLEETNAKKPREKLEEKQEQEESDLKPRETALSPLAFKPG